MKISKNGHNKHIYFLSIMTAIAVSLYFFEVLLPKPLPFMKIGFSNIVVLLLVFSGFWKEAFLVGGSKSIIGSFITGTLFSPTFVLSIFGTMFSVAIMIFVFRYLRGLTLVGLSICGSFAHLMTQLVCIRVFIICSDSIYNLYPVIAISSIVAGFITGLVAYSFNKHIDIRDIYAKINS
jgi:heptaprenyl diphosphate synthase